AQQRDARRDREGDPVPARPRHPTRGRGREARRRRRAARTGGRTGLRERSRRSGETEPAPPVRGSRRPAVGAPPRREERPLRDLAAAPGAARARSERRRREGVRRAVDDARVADVRTDRRGGQVPRSSRQTRSAVTGSARTRAPLASCTAFATAAGTPGFTSSPADRAPYGPTPWPSERCTMRSGGTSAIVGSL